jgi:hypothetical protein
MPDEEVDLKLPEDQLEIMRRVSMKLTGTSNLNKVKLALLLGSAVIGVAELNVDSRVGWLSWTLLVTQLILLVFLFKMLWSPLKQRLRG